MIKRIFFFASLLCLCIFTNSYALSFDPPASENVNRNTSIILSLSGGCQPYTWKVSGNDFNLDFSQTEDGSNTLHVGANACGSATINVIDGCGEQTEIKFRANVGEWKLLSYETSTPEGFTTPKSWGGIGYCDVTEIEGDTKTRYASNLGCGISSGEVSCSISCELGTVGECWDPSHSEAKATSCWTYEWVCSGGGNAPPGTELGGGDQVGNDSGATGPSDGQGESDNGDGTDGDGQGESGNGEGKNGKGRTGKDDCIKDPANVSNPITIYNGNKFELQRDILFPSPNRLRFKFNRYYNSQSDKLGVMGYGWTHSFGEILSSVDYEGQTYLMITASTGREIYFYDDENGRWAGAFNERSYLMAETDGYTWYKTDGSRYHFSYQGAPQVGTEGPLEWIEDAIGNRIALTYDTSDRLESVSDLSSQRVLNFYYNSDNLLSHISGPVTSAVTDGIWVEYLYDANDNLTSVTYADGSGFTYGYTDTRDIHDLTEKKDKLDNVLATWVYDMFGRAYESTTIDGRGVTINHQGDTKIQVTDESGFTRTYEMKRYDGVKRVTKITGDGCVSCGGQPVEYIYDNYFRRTYEKFANGSNRFYSNFDTNDNPRTVTYNKNLAGAKYVYFSYHPITNQKLSRKELSVLGSGYKETIWDYDDDGNTTPNENPTMLVHRLIERGNTYNSSGAIVSYEYVTTYEYNAKGQVTEINGPMAGNQDIVTFTYDPVTGDRLTQTLPLIGPASFQYDDAGNLTSATDVNGIVATFGYDGHNRLLDVTRNNKTTSRTFTLHGKIDTTTDAMGRIMDYDYTTNGRLEKIIDPDGDYLFFAYDAVGLRVESSILSQNDTLKYFHEIDYGDPSVNPDLAPGKPWKILQRNHDNTGTIETVLTYDDMGNIATVTDAESNTTSYVYDLYNRLYTVTQPGSVLTRYLYDAHGNLKQVTNAINRVTRYTSDDLGRLVKTVSQDSGTTLYSYDENSNLRFKTDNGVVTEYRYDDLDRLTDMIYSDSSQNVTLTYDSGTGSNLIGRWTSMTDPSGVTQYSYDVDGRLVTETKTMGGIAYVTGYGYDDAGNLESITYPTGQTIEYVPSGTDPGKIASVVLNPSGSNQPLASNVAYQPFGPVSGMNLGNGIALSKTFDLNYQISGLLYTSGNALMHRTYTPDNVGNITDITDHLDANRSQSFDYNDLYMLTNASGLYGSITYTYDNIGNRLSKNINGQNDSYYYSYYSPDRSYRLRSVSGANPVSFSYTPSGNTITKGNKSFDYNDNNRMVVSKQSGVDLAQQTYSANGQRTKKDDGASKVFHYDQVGQLIAETSASGALIKAYVWLHGQPLAQILPNDLVYYYHNDHLGTPQKMTDGSGTVVWSADYLPFGQTDVIIATIGNNLRFKGQYFDQETGLHYNYFRYYDPSLGRYLRADPIGLAGGINPYAYVQNNPVNLIDPFGLEDKWYGHNEPDFKDYVHDIKQKENRRGNQNYTKRKLDELKAQWENEGKPGGKGRKSGKGGSTKGGGRKGKRKGFGGSWSTMESHRNQYPDDHFELLKELGLIDDTECPD